MQTYEEFIALVRIFSDPKKLEAEVKRLEALKAQAAKAEADARIAQEEASAHRKTAELHHNEAVKLHKEVVLKEERMQQMLDQMELTKAASDGQDAKNEVLGKKLEHERQELNTQQRALAERIAAADKRDQEVAAIRRDLERRLASVKAAMA